MPEKVESSARITRKLNLDVQSTIKNEGNNVSIPKLCRWYGFPRSSLPIIQKQKHQNLWRLLSKREAIEEFPTFGVRRIAAVVNKRGDTRINHKKVERIVKENRWQLRKR